VSGKVAPAERRRAGIGRSVDGVDDRSFAMYILDTFKLYCFLVYSKLRWKREMSIEMGGCKSDHTKGLCEGGSSP